MITIDVDGNVIIFYYVARSDLSYVVNYLEQGTNVVLASQKVVGGQTFGSDVTEFAIDIAGYNQVPPTSVTITIDVTGTVINFYYSPVGPALSPVYSSVTATNEGNRAAIIAGINPKNGNPTITTKTTPTHSMWYQTAIILSTQLSIVLTLQVLMVLNLACL